jgi:hypothetical protein
LIYEFYVIKTAQPKWSQQEEQEEGRGGERANKNEMPWAYDSSFKGEIFHYLPPLSTIISNFFPSVTAT